MNTNALKKFAQKARNLLLDDVSKRFLYWGFDKKGNILHSVESTSGGYLFRGNAHDDVSIPAKWNSLVSAVGRHTVNDIIEEAAYTWFNRLMAIKILEQNGYDQPVLTYAAADLHEPVILRNAKKGIYPTSNQQEIQALKRKLAGANDDEALAALLVSYCRNHQLLNRIFGHLDDYTELLIPGDLMAKGGILELINDEGLISDEDYQEVELIGWLYQFYISDKKDDVFAGFKKKKKARAEDIPAATQIFTPKWIVNYLVENTVGRIWLDLHPESPIRETMKYLVEPENHTPDDPIINDVTELKVLDPAVGSGHFLVVAFDLLMQMYQEEGYSKRKAVASIIEHNLYGLDICPRAAGLANFAILLKAAQYHEEVLREAHFPKVLAMPEPYDFTSQQVGSFLETEVSVIIDEVHTALKILKQGQNIGSALILNLSDTSRTQLLHALSMDRSKSLDLTEQMTMKRIRPFAEVTSILTDHFPAVVANPPYMGSKNMNADLAAYLKAHYPRSKADLFAVFMEILPRLAAMRGGFGFITTPSWMFLGTYESLRKHYINNYFYSSLLHLSRGVFGADFGAVATAVQKQQANNRKGSFYRLVERTFQEFESDHLHQLLLRVLLDKSFKFDFTKYSREKGIPEKSDLYGKKIFYDQIAQSDFSKIPGSPITYWVSEAQLNLFVNQKISEYGRVGVGLQTGNNDRYIRHWFEVSCLSTHLRGNDPGHGYSWFRCNKGGDYRKWFGNALEVIIWKDNGAAIKANTPSAVIRNESCYFQPCVTWSRITSGNLSFRFIPGGFIHNDASCFIVGNSGQINMNLIAYLNSPLRKSVLEEINPTLNLLPGQVNETPYLVCQVNGVERLIEIARYDWDSSETSWDFDTLPALQPDSHQTTLKTTYQKLRVQWQEKTLEMQKVEEKNNRLFIDAYGMEDELIPEVPLNEITLTCNPNFRYSNDRSNKELEALLLADTIRELISYSLGCFMGRYRLDSPGLKIAHPSPSSEDLGSYEHNGYTFEIDDDAIIPMMGSESPFSDDIVERVQQFVLMVWGEESYTENLNFINEALGEDLEKFLTKKFWDFHKQMYKKRPIYWQFASPNGAFKVLTYMHRMNRFTVQKIRQNYLFKQINYLESEITRLKANEASLNSTEARKLDHFRSNLLECRDYDLLLKDVADKQIEFDLDDGVVENYKLFEGVVSKI